jgi:large subunit ribosomal protein L25
MEEIKLDVYMRNKDEIGSRRIKKLYRQNIVPAVVYGGKKKAPTPIKLDRRDYERIMRQHRGQSVVFHLNVKEGDKKLRDYSAIVKEEQHAPVLDDLLHIDFLRISLKEEVEVKIPIEIKGESIGVKKEGGSVDQPLRELDVVCLPTDIPEKIEVDVTEMNIGDAVHVGDLRLPPEVKTKHDPEAMVLSIVPPMKEEVEPEVPESIEPEVIKDEKKGEEEEEGGEEKPEGKAEAKAEEKKPKEKTDGKPENKPKE